MILQNSYNILWLDITSTQKEITKRWKDILKYLAIWEVPFFENDLDLVEEFRNEDYIKKSIDNLSNPKNRLIDIFFWFEIEYEEDKKIFNLINKWSFASAITLVKNSKNKKNLAILYSLILLNKDVYNLRVRYEPIELTKKLIDIFKNLLDDKLFWKLFEKKFFLYDDLSTNKKILEDFKSNLWEYLSDLFYDISKNLWDNNVLKLFNESFSYKNWNKTNNEIDIIYWKLTKIAERFESINISEDWIFDNEEKKIVRANIKVMQKYFNSIIEIWLYDTSKTLLMRDRLANSIRVITLDIHNNLGDREKWLSFLEIALGICWTEWLRHKIKDEINTIKENIINDENNFIELIIPKTLWDKELLFGSNKLTYDGYECNYNDILEYSFYSVKNSFNWVTTWTSYSIKYILPNKTIKIEFSSTLFNAWNDAKSELYSKIVWVSISLIEPLIIEKIKKNIFIDKNSYQIWDVTFTDKWYYIKGFFGWETWVLWWEETYWTPVFEAWFVCLFIVNNWKIKNLTNISMEIPNAVILPKMVPEFITYYNN
jgi:hypothetical protein